MIEVLAKGRGGMGTQTLPVGVQIGLTVVERNLAMKNNVEALHALLHRCCLHPV